MIKSGKTEGGGRVFGDDLWVDQPAGSQETLLVTNRRKE